MIRRIRHYSQFPEAIPKKGARSHALLTRPPLGPKPSLDLHVLSLPPAFVLSQDQTLKLKRPTTRQVPDELLLPGQPFLTAEPLHIIRPLPEPDQTSSSVVHPSHKEQDTQQTVKLTPTSSGFP